MQQTQGPEGSRRQPALQLLVTHNLRSSRSPRPVPGSLSPMRVCSHAVPAAPLRPAIMQTGGLTPRGTQAPAEAAQLQRVAGPAQPPRPRQAAY